MLHSDLYGKKHKTVGHHSPRSPSRAATKCRARIWDHRALVPTMTVFETLLALGPGLVLITSLDPASPPQGSEQSRTKVSYTFGS